MPAIDIPRRSVNGALRRHFLAGPRRRDCWLAQGQVASHLYLPGQGISSRACY